MNIHDLTSGPHRIDALRRVGASSTPHADTTGPDASKEAGAAADRVELSAAGRNAATEQDAIKREVEFARRAMYSIPPLSPERAEHILDQLQTGAYTAPDVLMKLTENLSNELAPRTSEAGGETS